MAYDANTLNNYANQSKANAVTIIGQVVDMHLQGAFEI